MTSKKNNHNPHSAFQTLPVVDISTLSADELPRRIDCAQALGQAARDAGFLYITGHGIPTHLIDGLTRRSREYFSLPVDRKMQDYIGQSVNHSGYVPEGEERFYSNSIDRKEAYDIGFDMPDPTFARPMLGPNQWPDLPGFKEDILPYYTAVLALGNTLFRGFALVLGLAEDTFTRHISRPPSQLRLIHYPFNPAMPPDTPGIGAHTDYECFTILLPTAPGLEVQNGAGEWIDAPPMPGAFVINIGDMMEILSNGIYVATSHRVRKVAEERYSFPMFCNLDYDTVIQPETSLISPDNPAKYSPLVAGEHLYAQTLQTFGYLKQRLAEGKVQLPKGAKGLSSFGRKAGGTA
ncbi:MAG TPA: 2-oxoglutarate and iron-dependent oxygenase domain-containing protein [Cellvibrionaceae bacterium]